MVTEPLSEHAQSLAKGGLAVMDKGAQPFVIGSRPLRERALPERFEGDQQELLLDAEVRLEVGFEGLHNDAPRRLGLLVARLGCPQRAASEDKRTVVIAAQIVEVRVAFQG